MINKMYTHLALNRLLSPFKIKTIDLCGQYLFGCTSVIVEELIREHEP